MKAIKFFGYNRLIAKNQEEYQTLPTHISKSGVVTSCWELTDREIKKIIKKKRIYLEIMTFNKALQPQRLTVDNPINQIKRRKK